MECKGGQGRYAPCKPIFSSFYLEETLENCANNEPCENACILIWRMSRQQSVKPICGPVREHRQCLLRLSIILDNRNLRVLGCIGSLSKTHTGVTAHLWTASGCPASENGIGNKKTATVHSRHQMPVKLHSSLCVFL